jgi:hypothetical protein
MLITTGMNSPMKNERQPASQYSVAATNAVQIAVNTGSGSAVSGEIRSANAGE